MVGSARRSSDKIAATCCCNHNFEWSLSIARWNLQFGGHPTFGGWWGCAEALGEWWSEVAVRSWTTMFGGLATGRGSFWCYWVPLQFHIIIMMFLVACELPDPHTLERMVDMPGMLGLVTSKTNGRIRLLLASGHVRMLVERSPNSLGHVGGFVKGEMCILNTWDALCHAETGACREYAKEWVLQCPSCFPLALHTFEIHFNPTEVRFIDVILILRLFSVSVGIISPLLVLLCTSTLLKLRLMVRRLFALKAFHVGICVMS